jgi:peptidyl-prolyl cis-trans isomerase C
LRERYLEKQLDGKINDAAIKAKYDELVKSMPPTDEVRASHILVGDEAKAKEVMAKLTKGEDFAALAKQYSIDPSKDQGGDLGYFVKNAMVKEFGEAAFAMNKGDVSKTPVKTQFGYHIIKVVDKRKQQPPELDKVKDAIRGRITEEKVRDIVDGLRGKAKIDFNLPGQAPEKK